MSSARRLAPGDDARVGDRQRDVVGEDRAEQLAQALRLPRRIDLLAPRARASAAARRRRRRRCAQIGSTPRRRSGGSVVAAIRSLPGALLGAAARTARAAAAPRWRRRARSRRARRGSPRVSATVRVSMPSITSAESPSSGAAEMRPRLGFSPTSPQQAAGMRIEPPPSLPCATGSMPLATAAAAPPGGAAGRALEVPRVARRAEDARLGRRAGCRTRAASSCRRSRSPPSFRRRVTLWS